MQMGLRPTTVGCLVTAPNALNIQTRSMNDKRKICST